LAQRVYNSLKKSAENFSQLVQQKAEDEEDSDGSIESESEINEVKRIKGVKKPQSDKKKGKEQIMEESLEEDETLVVRGKKGVKTNEGISKKQVVVQPGKEYKKGKYNYFIDSIPAAQLQLEATDDKPVFGCSVRNNDREVIRAAITGNKKLMKTILESKNRISTVSATWGLDNQTSAFLEMCRRNDTEMLKLFLGKLTDTKNKIEFADLPAVELEQVQTGYNNKYAYGVATRKVNLSRGGRQGNNAFVEESDSTEFNIEDVDVICSLLKIKEVKIETLKVIISYYPLFENELISCLDEILLSGRTDIAEYVLKKAESKGGYGTNEYFIKALTGTKQAVSSIQRQSVTKKAFSMKNVSPIHCACLNPNGEVLKHLLTVNPEFQNMDQRMRKPIHYAACSPSVQSLAYLISQNIDPKDHDHLKRTPLMYASQAGRLENVRFLIAENRSILTAKDRYGKSAIHYAAENGHTHVIKLLLDSGVKIALGGPDRKTALHIAAARGDFETVQFLVEHGAKVPVKDKFKRSPLLLACKNGNLKVAAYLLQQGSPFDEGDSSGNSPLHYACAYGYPEVIEVLMKAGANPNAVNSWNLSPTAVALLKSYFSCLRKMLDYPQTDVNCVDDEGRTLVSNSVKVLNEESLIQVTFLIKDKKANPNIADAKGLTAFDYLCIQSPLTMTRHGLQSKKVNPVELQPLFQKNTELYNRFLEVFLQSGINLNHQDKQGFACVHRAIRNRNILAVEKLIAHKEVNFQTTSKDGTNVLHCLSRLSVEQGLEVIATKIVSRLGKSVNGLLVQYSTQTGTTPALELLKYFGSIEKKIKRRIKQKEETVAIASILQSKGDKKKSGKSKTKGKDMDEEGEDDENEEDEEEDDNNDNDDEEEEEENESSDEESTRRNKNKEEEESEESKRAREDNEFWKMMKKSENEIENSYFTFYKDTWTGRGDLGLSIKDEEKLKEAESLHYGALIKGILGTLKLFYSHGADVHAPIKNPLRKFGKRFIELDDFFSPNYFERLRKVCMRRIQDKLEDYTALAEDCGETAVHLAVKTLDMTLVKGLIETYKANIDAKSAADNTPLMLLPSLVENDSLPRVEACMQYLLARKADTQAQNLEGESAVTLCIQSGQRTLLKLLIDVKANLNQINKEGEFPLLVAVKEEDASLVELLLVHGANPSLLDGKKRNCLHWAINNATDSTDAPNEIIPLLVAYGADVNQLDLRNRTPLHYAFVKIGDPFCSRASDPIQNIVELLQRPGVNVDVRDAWGNTPLSYAAQRGSVISTLYLLKYGATLDNLNNDGNTPLGIALHYGHENITIFLLQKGASLSKPVMEGRIDDAKNKYETAKKAENKKIKIKQNSQNNEDANYELDWTSEESILDEESDKENKMDEEKIKKRRDEDDEDLENDEEDESQDDDDEEEERNKKSSKPENSKERKAKVSSMFLIAIKRDWQSVAFLMLEFGFDLSLAILDCFNHKKYNYVYTLLLKKADAGVYQTTNADGQNLTHLFAQNSSRISDDLFSKILSKLEAKHLDFGSADKAGRTSLHYAAEAGSVKLATWLLERGLDVNKSDSAGVTPLGHVLKSSFPNVCDFIQLGLKYKLDLNKKFSFDQIDHTALTYIVAEDKNLDTFIKLHELGADINLGDSKARSPLIHLIKRNKTTAIENFSKLYKLNYKAVDNTGKTIIHYVVLPNDFGSYQNIKLLKLLSKHADVNQKDKLGRSPLSYAIENRCDTLVADLKKLGAKEPEEFAIRRAPTSLLTNVMFEEQMYNFEEDFEKFVEQCKREASTKEAEFVEKCQVDENATGNYEVCYDGEDPYDCYMVKVDISYGYYSGNTFYKMQILRERVRDVFVLFTRWGRVGTSGQYQQTPFSTIADARKEFCSVFKSKSGNLWEDRHNFVKVDKKYRLVPVTKRTKVENYIKAISFKNTKLPDSNLEEHIFRTMRRLCNSNIYVQALRRLFDFEVPIHSLTKERISDAQAVLDGISKALEQMEKVREKQKGSDHDGVNEIAEEISKLSSEYYELVPVHKFTAEAIPPISNEHALQEEKRKLIEMTYNEVTLKLLGAAFFQRLSINPVDYVMNCLTVKMLQVSKESLEFRVIE
jgi:ankyrin repeat protein/predicted DNA-binding WGR domain protein